MTAQFIAFEGIDGSGKSTIANRLHQAFGSAGIDAILTREPGGTALGEQIRSLLLRDESAAMLPETETLLFAAARAQLVGEIIRPALERGAAVITDRFADSSLAYQWGGRELDHEAVLAAQRLATAGLEPDIKILLDLPIEMALRRRIGGVGVVNRLDREAFEFHSRVRSAYHSLARDDPARWHVVDASRSEDLVWWDVARVFGLTTDGVRQPRRELNQRVVR